MPGWVWIILVVVALVAFKVVHDRRRYRDPKYYFARASARMDQLERIMARTQANLNRPNPSPAQLAMDLNNLRSITYLQQIDVVPHPSLEDHKQKYWQMMDIQRRKLEDIIATGGRNLEELVAEEEAFTEASMDEWRESYDKGKALADSLGIDMPDWAEEPPGR